MKEILIFCALMFGLLNVSNAHNPLSAMYNLDVKGDFGILNIGLSQDGLNQALIKSFPDVDIENLSSLEYKKLAVKYIKDNFTLSINDQDIAILDGGIKLGNHQTDLKFITSEIPKDFKTLAIEIDAYRENKHHQTIFLLSLNGNSSKVILSEKNEYQSSLVLRDNKMIIEVEGSSENYFWYLLLIPMLIIGMKVLK